jgi:putative component of membrane protein insertase Oxa1/YidC/SpoIIIJ protein YidD
MLRSGSLALIGAYQRHVSPYKGYCCAYRARTGGRSCSRYAQRAIWRAGWWSGLILLRRRLRACAAAAIAIEETKEKTAEEAFFGACAPAVQEGRKLCCGSVIGGLLDSQNTTRGG